MGDDKPIERQEGLQSLVSDVGYLKGVVQGLDEKLDIVLGSVIRRQDEQDVKIARNTKDVAHVTKRVDRAYWTLTGISGTLAVFITKWHVFTKFIHDFFTGSGGGHS